MPRGSGKVHDEGDPGVDNLIGYLKIKRLKDRDDGEDDYADNLFNKNIYKPFLKIDGFNNPSKGKKLDFKVKEFHIVDPADPTSVVSKIKIAVPLT